MEKRFHLYSNDARSKFMRRDGKVSNLNVFVQKAIFKGGGSVMFFFECWDWIFNSDFLSHESYGLFAIVRQEAVIIFQILKDKNLVISSYDNYKAHQ